MIDPFPVSRRERNHVSWTPARRSLDLVLRRPECAELVAVEIAEIAGVEGVAARPGRSLVLAAELESEVVDLVHLFLRGHGERDHRAVAGRGRCLVVRRADAEHRA